MNTNRIKFSSPIFGDMFLLEKEAMQLRKKLQVFVSYIRRYVLTKVSTSKVVKSSVVFVSYIRRYVLTIMV